MVEIAASILAADEERLEEEIADVIASGADAIHIDVMDGVFVNNTTDGEKMIKAAKENTEAFLDVHLMVENPLAYLEKFQEADRITFHMEAVNENEANEIIETLHQRGKKVGIAIKPNTKISALKKYLERIDMVLIMTVEPGFGGQKLIPETLEKVRKLRSKNASLAIEVDGGINLETSRDAIKAGANILVAGTAIFKHQNRREIIDRLRNNS
ncbi:MAG: ribulose-phosphate 3-epimerase [Clostridia bacterium]|nr:ribulose-phosphate 3-epimerase [Clostridia bacterium]